jgi:hypothetical protein
VPTLLLALAWAGVWSRETGADLALAAAVLQITGWARWSPAIAPDGHGCAPASSPRARERSVSGRELEGLAHRTRRASRLRRPSRRRTAIDDHALRRGRPPLGRARRPDADTPARPPCSSAVRPQRARSPPRSRSRDRASPNTSPSSSATVSSSPVEAAAKFATPSASNASVRPAPPWHEPPRGGTRASQPSRRWQSKPRRAALTADGLISR